MDIPGNDQSESSNPLEQTEIGELQEVAAKSAANLGERVRDDGHNLIHQSFEDLYGGMDVDATEDETRVPALPYMLVAIGASAGGLQAIREIFSDLSPATGMTFVLVTHLAPDQKSHLIDIMERTTSMPVLAIEDGQTPLTDHLYVLLPNQFVRLKQGAFRTEERPKGNQVPATIDIFFRSVAEEQKSNAIGVVLSGADSDGARGLKTIKDEGGISLVQSPDSALHSSMPRSSIAADHVDLVLPPAQIAIELTRLAHQFGQPALKPLEQRHAPQGTDQAFQRILHRLKSAFGIDFDRFKPETIRRRMARRMILLRLDTLSDYLQLLQTRPDELRALEEDLLINVTRFFRDAGFWSSIETNVLPALFYQRMNGKPIRIWCAGCSTGEEVYSLAILFTEYMARHSISQTIQIFGTDASDRSVEIARAGTYTDSISNEVSQERLANYFVKTDHSYQVSKSIREICIFARQNLCNDPPFSHIDLISCRNVMIYFNQSLQRQIMSTFHYALEANAYMLLGMSEGLRDYSDHFTVVDRKHKVYMKTGDSLSLVASRDYRLSAPDSNVKKPIAEPDRGAWSELDLKRAADRIVLTRFGPPGLIIDERLNVLQSRGQTSPFIELMPGAVDWNLFRMLKGNLAKEVMAAAQRSIAENAPVSTSYVAVEELTGEQRLQIDVLPISSSNRRTRCFLILFRTVEENERRRTLDRPSQPLLSGSEKEHLIPKLLEELETTKFNLQSLIEERDARNQELSSANEEIQSANEELQSTNEELETTKEELQSSNEELQTLNEELKQRNLILALTGNDLSNLLTSVNIPLLMLTSDLQIRQYTPPMQKLLSVRPTDIGRSISEIRLQLSLDNIEPMLREVLETLTPQEVEVQDKEGRWFLLRIRPYRTADNKIEGLVVVLVDIDQLRRSQQASLEARDFAKSMLESVPLPIVVLDKDCTIRTVNSAFRQLTQLREKELHGRSLPDLVQLLWGFEDLGIRMDSVLDADEGASFNYEHASTTADARTLKFSGQALSNDGSKVLLLVIEDVTIQRAAERVVSLQTTDLESEVQAAAIELDRTQAELHGLTAHLFSVQEEERQKVARELHDDISQRLSLLQLIFVDIHSNADALDKSQEVEKARALLESLNTDVRAISHQLHPAILDDLGLSAALKSLVEEFGRWEGMPATYRSIDLPVLRPQPSVTALYRITQEALRNVSKHAGKTHVKVTLGGTKDGLRLEVKDLGVGFDQAADDSHSMRGLGMVTMKERARLAHGTLYVHSALGEGTSIIAEVPLEDYA